jgi:hypothetical protein
MRQSVANGVEERAEILDVDFRGDKRSGGPRTRGSSIHIPPDNSRHREERMTDKFHFTVGVVYGLA